LKKTVAIIGGGAASIMLALKLDATKYSVTIYEKNRTLGRKFLVAGDGGLNLTHASDIELMIKQYDQSVFLKSALLSFSNFDLRNTLQSMGIETFIGSSNRVFPAKSIKPITVLNALVTELKQKNVSFKFEHQWTGWDANMKLLFKNGGVVSADYTAFAMGGASWKVTGSDGIWKNIFENKGIETKPFLAANCAFGVAWDKNFIKNHAGKPLKNISIRIGKYISKGELVISEFGIEGNAIYALSKQIQQALLKKGKAHIYINLKPMLSIEQVNEKLNLSKGKNRTYALKNHLKLSATQIQLLKMNLSKEDYLNDLKLTHAISNFPISITQSALVDEAISTIGGIALDEVNAFFELKKIPNSFCLGEMLNWNAPTGGYLLQACFSMGAFLAQHLNDLE